MIFTKCKRLRFYLSISTASYLIQNLGKRVYTILFVCFLVCLSFAWFMAKDLYPSGCPSMLASQMDTQTHRQIQTQTQTQTPIIIQTHTDGQIERQTNRHARGSLRVRTHIYIYIYIYRHCRDTHMQMHSTKENN